MKTDVRLVSWAAEHAESLLAPLGHRWLHVQGVVETARWVGAVLDAENCSYLIAAAYVHDIGYAPSLIDTGFHPVDGARFLRSCGYERLACLVAHHSEARFEARLRGLTLALEEFPRERSATTDALVYCDLTVGLTGEQVSLKERARDVYARYGEMDIVSQAFRQAMPSVALAISRTRLRLRKCGLSSEVHDAP